MVSTMVRGSSKTVVKRTRDEALEHIKLALRSKCCLFTKQEMSFIRTSCQILGVDSQATTRAIQDEVESRKIKAAKEGDGASAGSVEGAGGKSR